MGFANLAQTASIPNLDIQKKNLNIQINQGDQYIRQLRRSARPQDMQYINQIENNWNQIKALNARFQQFQLPNVLNQGQLLPQQQNLKDQLMKQQKLLQQQLAAIKAPGFQTINPFGDYVFHGVSLHPEDGHLHGPGTIADTPELNELFPGMKAWKEAMRQSDSIANVSQSPSNAPSSSSQTAQKTGAFNNPFANDPNVVDLRDSKTLTPNLLREDESKREGYPLNKDQKEPVISPEAIGFFREPNSLKHLLMDASAQVLVGADQYDIQHYGNWLGKDWSGGRRGDKAPVDQLDANGMKHDFGYDVARKQGEIYGPQEEYRLKAIADAILVKETMKLDPDPTRWTPPAKDPYEANRYADRVLWVFQYIKEPYDSSKSAYYSWTRKPAAPDQDAVNKYDANSFNLAVDLFLKDWKKKHPNASP